MSRERSNYNDADDHTSLSDLNLLGLLSATGSEWTSLIRQESQALCHPFPEKARSGSTRSWILLGTLSALVFMSAATLTQPKGHYTTPQNVKTAITQ